MNRRNFLTSPLVIWGFNVAKGPWRDKQVVEMARALLNSKRIR